MIRRIAPFADVFLTVDQNILRDTETRKGAANLEQFLAPWPLGSEGFRLNDEEVYVGVGIRCVRSAGTKQDDLFGIYRRDDGFDHFGQNVM